MLGIVCQLACVKGIVKNRTLLTYLTKFGADTSSGEAAPHMPPAMSADKMTPAQAPQNAQQMRKKWKKQEEKARCELPFLDVNGN